MALEASIETLEDIGGAKTAIVTLAGLMTLGTNLKTAEQKVQTAIDVGAKHLILDLTGVTYSDSAGLGMMVHTYGLIKAKGGTFRLCSVCERVLAMLKLTTTDRFLPVDTDRTASLAALTAGRVEG